MKVLIAIPAMNQVPTQFAASLAILQKPEDAVVGFQVGSLVYQARNNIAKAAVDMGAEVVFWLDSDMTFEPDTLKRLLDDYSEHKDAIISGIYFKRVAPYVPVLYEVFNIENGETTHLIHTKIPEEIFEVQACGFGCVLTPVKILKDVMDKYGAPFNPIGGNGEDLSFCWRARQLGYKVIADPSVECGHVGYQVITRSFWETYYKNIGG
jgi:GT2 family glycosyltransferase